MPITTFNGAVNNAPAVYMIERIYDPIAHGPYGDANNGLIVPAIGSIVIDNVTAPGEYVVKIVDAVDSVTLETTLLLPYLLPTDGTDRILNYGSETLMVFYDKRTSPTLLVVDSKLAIHGSNSVEYQLFKVVNGVRQVVSVRIDNTGSQVGTRIPIVDSGAPGIKKLSESHTTHPIEDGDLLELEIYDSRGVQTTIIRLLAKRASILNDYLSTENPIVDFTATANQNYNGQWVVYVGQNPEDLDIWPEVVYADGSRLITPVNGMDTQVYGISDIVTNIPESEFPVMIKHFLADHEPASNVQGDNQRFLLYETVIRVLSRVITPYTKISIIPLWDSVNSIWTLSFVVYFVGRDRFEYLNNNQVTVVGFDGSNTSAQQNLQLSINVIDEYGDPQLYQQDVTIRLNSETAAVPWTISDSENNPIVYGATTTSVTKPIINYDSVLGQYYIPTSKFNDLSEVLDNFYNHSLPPILPNLETVPPTPTHFILRDGVNGRSITAAPIELATYEQSFTLLTQGGLPDSYNDSTVIVEFLQADGNSFEILYGVPVDVMSGTYNT